MIVIDNSVLVPAIITSANSAQARKAAARDAQWILPPLWKFEFTNVMATLLRSRVIDEVAARSALADAQTLVSQREVAVDQVHALRLAVGLSISGYDAQYLALADAYGVRCVTEDQELVRQSGGLAVLLDEFQN